MTATRANDVEAQAREIADAVFGSPDLARELALVKARLADLEALCRSHIRDLDVNEQADDGALDSIADMVMMTGADPEWIEARRRHGQAVPEPAIVARAADLFRALGNHDLQLGAWTVTATGPNDVAVIVDCAAEVANDDAWPSWGPLEGGPGALVDVKWSHGETLEAVVREASAHLMRRCGSPEGGGAETEAVDIAGPCPSAAEFNVVGGRWIDTCHACNRALPTTPGADIWTPRDVRCGCGAANRIIPF